MPIHVADDREKTRFIMTHLRGCYWHWYPNVETHPDTFSRCPDGKDHVELIRYHLDGLRPVGTNLIRDCKIAQEDWRATALAFDIDTKDQDGIRALLAQMEQVCGPVINLEYTGNRYHAWVFFSRPMPLRKLQALVHLIPIQSYVGKVLCSSVPCLPVSKPKHPIVFPWSKHHTTRERSFFVDARAGFDKPTETIIVVDEEYIDGLLAKGAVTNDAMALVSEQWARTYDGQDDDSDVWDLPESEQKERIEALRVSGIPEGRRNDIFVLKGHALLLIKLYPDDWEDVGEEILLEGIVDPHKCRERRRWWRKRGIPYYKQALDAGTLALGRTRFHLARRYRDSERAGDAIEDLLDDKITSDSVLINLVDLVRYMLDLQSEAERIGSPTFFRSLGAMADDIGGAYRSIQTLSRHLPFIVSGYRFDRTTGEDLCRVPIFQCVNKAEPWQADKPRTKVATEYQLDEEYRWLLDL